EMCPVGSLGGEVAQATAVNSGGETVGVAQLSGSETVHAFVGKGGEKATDLGTLGG
ncbi:MAG: HAF repeat/PEP-CTERM domain-containing protein, partial [Armatimonadetes bacterium]|nr:HAF repeat/PEP-CTERM domain-containing protein [Armatimonadota bacterium]